MPFAHSFPMLSAIVALDEQGLKLRELTTELSNLKKENGFLESEVMRLQDQFLAS
jgi:hypothetical protein